MLIEKKVVKSLAELVAADYEIDFTAGASNTAAAAVTAAKVEVVENPELIAAAKLLFDNGFKVKNTKSGRPHRVLGKKSGLGDYAVSVSIAPPSK